jgi:transcriptional regulator with XRE-family HTH domain
MRKWREVLQVSRRQVAEISGLTEEALRKYETGRRQPDAHKVLSVCAALVFFSKYPRCKRGRRYFDAPDPSYRDYMVLHIRQSDPKALALEAIRDTLSGFEGAEHQQTIGV